MYEVDVVLCVNYVPILWRIHNVYWTIFLTVTSCKCTVIVEIINLVSSISPRIETGDVTQWAGKWK